MLRMRGGRGTVRVAETDLGDSSVERSLAAFKTYAGSLHQLRN